MTRLLRLTLCAMTLCLLGEGATLLAAALAPGTCCAAVRLPGKSCCIAEQQGPAAAAPSPVRLAAAAPTSAFFALPPGNAVSVAASAEAPLARRVSPGRFDRGPPARLS